MSYLPDWITDAATLAAPIEFTTGCSLPVICGAVVGFRLPAHPDIEARQIAAPATDQSYSYERVTLVGELRSWLFNFAMQPRRSIPKHFG